VIFSAPAIESSWRLDGSFSFPNEMSFATSSRPPSVRLSKRPAPRFQSRVPSPSNFHSIEARAIASSSSSSSVRRVARAEAVWSRFASSFTRRSTTARRTPPSSRVSFHVARASPLSSPPNTCASGPATPEAIGLARKPLPPETKTRGTSPPAPNTSTSPAGSIAQLLPTAIPSVPAFGRSTRRSRSSRNPPRYSSRFSRSS
jgi:hypothetical protein